MNQLNENNPIAKIERTIPNNQVEPLQIINIQIKHGIWVEERFLNKLQQLIREVFPVLQLGQIYTAKILCGKEFWDSLEKRDRIKAGKCIAYMVANKILPLTFAGTTKEHSLQYKLK